MFNLRKAQAGFTLIEVVAAAALLGLMVTITMPSLNAANTKVRDSKLKADLATVDQAIQLYIIDNGKVPENLADLAPDYLTKTSDITDATNKALTYSGTGTSYTLTGKNTAGKDVYSNGSLTAPTEPEPEPEVKQEG